VASEIGQSVEICGRKKNQSESGEEMEQGEARKKPIPYAEGDTKTPSKPVHEMRVEESRTAC